jgi:hypothetical protein
MPSRPPLFADKCLTPAPPPVRSSAVLRFVGGKARRTQIGVALFRDGRSASDTGESSLASATRARPEDSGRQEARARILSQSSYVAQFNTTQFRTDRLRRSPNSWRSRLSQVVANRQPIEPVFYPPERTVFGRRRVPITSNQSRRCLFLCDPTPLCSCQNTKVAPFDTATPLRVPFLRLISAV